MNQPGPDNFEIEVCFDGGCPLCRREIGALQWLDRRRKLRFTDISGPDFQAAAVGTTDEALMARMHARLPDGTWLEGVEVFRRMDVAVGFGPLVSATYWEVGRRIVEHEQGGEARAEYGQNLLVSLATDLTAKHGRGFSKSNLYLRRTRDRLLLSSEHRAAPASPPVYLELVASNAQTTHLAVVAEPQDPKPALRLRRLPWSYRLVRPRGSKRPSCCLTSLRIASISTCGSSAGAERLTSCGACRPRPKPGAGHPPMSCSSTAGSNWIASTPSSQR